MKKLIALLLLTMFAGASAQDAAPDAWLLLRPAQFAVSPPPFTGDRVLARLLAGGAVPVEGEDFGGAKWEAVRSDEKGEIHHDAYLGGYAFGRLTSDSDRVVIASVRGAASFFVNGELFTGDYYDHRYVRVPLLLRKGENRVIARLAVRSSDPIFSFRLADPPAPLVINTGDAKTLPDLFEGEALDSWGAIPVLNATNETVRGAVLTAGDAKTDVPSIPPLGILKVPFPVRIAADFADRVVVDPLTKEPRLPLPVSVTHAGKTHEETLILRVRKKTQSFKRTYRSNIDDSVQYYAALLPSGFDPKRPYALVLGLHGATVEAESLPDVFTPREWCIVVTPTNRRPFGFDWEEWGRLDTIEVLDQVQKDYLVDPSRIYLMGHSMGGHGTWHLSVLYPDRFAAAGPSAGWISFWSYGGSSRFKDELQRLFQRSMTPSDTLALLRNLESLPVFILHGDKDEDVPFAESERMAKELGQFHHDFRTYWEKGGAHWWDHADTPGTDCMNFGPLFDFFQQHRRPDTVDRIDFRTFNPAVSSRYAWVEILAQSEPLALSRVEASCNGPKIEITTRNIEHLRLRRTGEVLLDKTPFTVDKTPAEFFREGRLWKAGRPAGLRKTPELSGPFKQAFKNRFLLVYGTGGDEDETRANLAKARYDSQYWWYQGNGCGRIVADTDVTPEAMGTNTLILYGNEESNAVWKQLADKLPIRVRKGSVDVAGDAVEGDLAVAAIYPNPMIEDRVVGLIGATGPGGRRAWWGTGTWFRSGMGTPDVTVWDADVFDKGSRSVRVAGYFGSDWKPCARLWFPAKAKQEY